MSILDRKINLQKIGENLSNRGRYAAKIGLVTYAFIFGIEFLSRQEIFNSLEKLLIGSGIVALSFLRSPKVIEASNSSTV